MSGVRRYAVDMSRSNIDPPVWEDSLLPAQFAAEKRRITAMVSLGRTLQAQRVGSSPDATERRAYYAAIDQCRQIQKHLQTMCEGRTAGEVVEVNASGYLPFVYQRRFENPIYSGSIWADASAASVGEDLVFWARPSSSGVGWEYLEQPDELGKAFVCNADLYAGRLTAGYDQETGISESWVPRLNAYGVVIGVTRIIEADQIVQIPLVPEQTAF